MNNAKDQIPEQDVKDFIMSRSCKHIPVYKVGGKTL